MIKSLRFIGGLVQPTSAGGNKLSLLTRAMSASADYTFKTIKVSSPAEYVTNVELNRPERKNALNTDLWRELAVCFNQLATDQDCRVIILSGAGTIFTSGIDLTGTEVFQKAQEFSDPGRGAFFLRRVVLEGQETFNSIEKCTKPVIAAIHGACIGAGTSMISACDIRYCTQDTWFQIKEAEIGLAADMGALQRIQRITGNDSLFREYTYTVKKIDSGEAKSLGLVSRVVADKNELMASSLELAKVIASKSPIAVQGSKRNIVYSRDHNVPDSLEYMATWNAVMLQSEDVMKALSAAIQKEKPEFSKL